MTIALLVQASILTDSRLKEVVDLDKSLVQITDVCNEFSAMSHVPLKVNRNISDLKVDLFVEKKSLSSVMDEVAKVLDCQWVQDGNGYRLEMDIPKANHEKVFNLAEDELSKKYSEALISACEYAAKNTPPDPNSDKRFGLLPPRRKFELLDPFENELEAATKANDPTRLEEANRQYLAASRTIGDGYMTGLGRVFLRLSDAQKEQFWKGEPLVASTMPGPGLKLDPADQDQSSYFTITDADGNPRKVTPLVFEIVRYRPATGDIRASFNSYGVYPGMKGNPGASHTNGVFSAKTFNEGVPGTLKKLPFYEDLEPWTHVQDVAEKFPQKLDASTKIWPSPWSSMKRRLGDHLRWFHLATGIPVVAQADRSCTTNWVQLNRNYPDAKTYIQKLVEDNKTFCKEDSGFFLARNFRYWTHRRHEASEAQWSKFESVNTPHDLNFFIQVAGSFREDQLTNEEVDYPLTTFDAFGVANSYDALRFLSQLTSNQMAAASADDGLAIATLGTDQQQAAIDTIVKMLSESGSCSYGMAKTIVSAGVAPSELRSMRVTLHSHFFDGLIDYGRELREGNQVIQKAVPKRYPGNQYTIGFGFSDAESVSQFIDVAK
ncbi:MAG: hypothetical protein GC165_01600 [Armatimonadetes bacterium]|nr:hypothetical protein [Armatimonadota bacterium]